MSRLHFFYCRQGAKSRKYFVTSSSLVSSRQILFEDFYKKLLVQMFLLLISLNFMTLPPTYPSLLKRGHCTPSRATGLVQYFANSIPRLRCIPDKDYLLLQIYRDLIFTKLISSLLKYYPELGNGKN